MKTVNHVEKILRCTDVQALLGRSRSWIYEVKNPTSRYFDPSFPAPIHLGAKSRGWIASELNAWIESRKSARTTNLEKQ